MRFEIKTGKKSKIKIGSNVSFFDVIEKVENSIGKKVDLSDITVDGEYAIYSKQDTKIVEIDDNVIVSKLKAIIKKEAGVSGNNIDIQIVKEKQGK
jgi:hypothetical protein